MALRINDTAPDFTAQTTRGEISFHAWLGSSWGVLFSHPKDFTPVCTTELGALAGLEHEFAKRDVKVIGLSVDPVNDHERWLANIKDVTGHLSDYPLIADNDLSVAKIYNMPPADWQPGEDVIILPAVLDEEAKTVFPDGWEKVKPYLWRVPDPN